jgi:hypothetical protein
MHTAWDVFKVVRMSGIDNRRESYQFWYLHSICSEVRYRWSPGRLTER